MPPLDQAAPLLPAATYGVVLLLSLLSTVTTCAGVALALWIRERAGPVALGIGFSTGIMLLISLVELVPRGLSEAGPYAVAAAAASGGLAVWLLNLVLPHTHLAAERGLLRAGVVSAAYLVPLGLIIHDVPEGFAMASAYVSAPSAGVVVALGIALHNIPEEFAMSLAALGAKSKRYLFGMAALSSLAEPAGALLGLVAVDLALALNAHLMAFAAGAMLFVSLHELAPLARRYGRPGMFIAGNALAALVYLGLDRLVAA